MQSERTSEFSNRPITMKKMVMIDSNQILLKVINSVLKYSIGDADIFAHWQLADLVKLQELLCKYIVWNDTGKNITLFDITDNLDDLISLKFEFLEFNFGFFSQARKILQKVNGQLTERESSKDQIA